MWSSGTLARWHQRKKQLKQAVRNIGLSQRSRAKLEGFTACELPISVNNSEPAKKDSSKEVHFRIDDLTSSDGPPNLARCWISKSLSLFSSFLITSSPPSSPFHLLLTLLQDECFNGSFIFTIQPIFYLQLCLLYFFLFISLLSNFLPRWRSFTQECLNYFSHFHILSINSYWIVIWTIQLSKEEGRSTRSSLDHSHYWEIRWFSQTKFRELSKRLELWSAQCSFRFSHVSSFFRMGIRLEEEQGGDGDLEVWNKLHSNILSLHRTSLCLSVEIYDAMMILSAINFTAKAAAYTQLAKSTDKHASQNSIIPLFYYSLCQLHRHCLFYWAHS